MSTQEQLDDLMAWEKVYEWAKQPELPTWLLAEPRYHNLDAKGISGNPLFCPLACYLNEKIDDGTDWRVRHGKANRYEYDQRKYYDLPVWAGTVELLVDEYGNGVGISQEMLLAILEAVKPREEKRT